MGVLNMQEHSSVEQQNPAEINRREQSKPLRQLL